MLVQKSIAREMLARIEQRGEGGESWAWRILRSLPDTGNNLFSEYETYGHYVKNHHPERVRFINRAWQREFDSHSVRAVPGRQELQELARSYDYVAFERAVTGWRRLAKSIVTTLRPLRGLLRRRSLQGQKPRR